MRTGATTLNKTGLGAVNLNDVDFRTIDGTDDRSAFAFTVSSGALADHVGRDLTHSEVGSPHVDAHDPVPVVAADVERVEAGTPVAVVLF